LRARLIDEVPDGSGWLRRLRPGGRLGSIRCALGRLCLVDLLADGPHGLLSKIGQDRLEGLLDLPPERILQCRSESRRRRIPLQLCRSARSLVDDSHARSVQKFPSASPVAVEHQ